MKPLEQIFRKNGFDYQQVWRDEDYAIYEQWDGEKLIAYEVFKTNKNEAREIAGVAIAASESVPGNKQWGTNAWTVYTLEEAQGKVDMMKSNRKQETVTL